MSLQSKPKVGTFTRNAPPVVFGHRRPTRLVAALVVISMVVPMFLGLALFAGQSGVVAPTEPAVSCVPLDVECGLE